MVNYRDIREFKRSSRYLGQTFTVLAWSDAGKFYVSAIDITGYPQVKADGERGFTSLEAAMEHGQKLARDYIDEL